MKTTKIQNKKLAALPPTEREREARNKTEKTLLAKKNFHNKFAQTVCERQGTGALNAFWGDPIMSQRICIIKYNYFSRCLDCNNVANNHSKQQQ